MNTSGATTSLVEPVENEAVKFKVQLITTVLLNSFKKLDGWKLSAGELDNVTLEWSKGSILLQAKHRMKPVTVQDLLSCHPENHEFSIPKCFLYYQSKKAKFQPTSVIVCTNVSIKMDKGSRQLVSTRIVNRDSVLYCHGHDCRYYTFNEAATPLVKKSVRDYVRTTMQGDDSVITDENINDFIERLQFFYDYPSGRDLDNVIEQFLYGKEISNIFYKKSSSGILDEVTKWFRKPKEYLTDTHASAIFGKTRSHKYREHLHRYNVWFKSNHFNFDGEEKVFHVVTQGGYLLGAIRVFRAMQVRRTNALYINPDDDVDMKIATIDAFRLLDHPFLVIIWPDTQEQALSETIIKLRETLESCSYKRVIVVGDGSVQRIGSCGIRKFHAQVTYEDLTEDTQEVIINKRNIVFQGESTSLRELVGWRGLEWYGRVANSGILERLVRSEDIKVGSVVQPLREEISYYTPRTFARESDDDDDEREDETLSEENVYEVRNKFVIIENRGGMGKTTVLKHLAWVIKEKHPHLWVIRVEFNKYTSVLKEFLKKNRDTISLMDLLGSQDTTKLETEFERHVFSLEGKVVLILDGVDEINEDIDPYLGLILGLLEQCREAPNIAKVFVASREHAIQTLPEKLNVTPFRLLPFTEDDYVDFFANFWTYKLRLTDGDKDKCRIYSKTVVRKMRSWINPDLNAEDCLVVVPLQMKMLAEIFQESGRLDWDGCVEFLNDVKPIPKLPKKINITSLFKTLIEKKQSLVDEGDSSDQKADGQMLIRKYNECLAYRKLL